MSSLNKGIDIAKNIRIIEWLKAEMTGSLAALFKAMLKGKEEKIVESLSSMIITAYVLARRLGVNFSRIDLTIESKLREEIKEEHELEQWHGDLSALLRYVTEKKR